MTHAPLRHPVTGVLLTLIVSALAVLGPMAAPANAHDQVQSTLPADQEHVDLPPSAIAITFTDDILEIGAIVMVVDAKERNWAEGDMRLDGPQATQPVAPDLPDGAYQVRWRVVSADGHPISGAFAFAVGAAALPGDDAEATATATPTPTLTLTPTPTRDGEAGTAASTKGTDTDTDTGAAGTGLPLGVVGLIGAIGGAAIFALVAAWNASRRRNP